MEKTSKLLAEPTTEGAELDDYHPCEVAKGAGGIFGPWGQGDGSTAPENMMYADWNDCSLGDWLWRKNLGKSAQNSSELS